MEPNLNTDFHMSNVLNMLYKEVDPESVSVASAFICLLHLANEKGLIFESEAEADFLILKQ